MNEPSGTARAGRHQLDECIAIDLNIRQSRLPIWLSECERLRKSHGLGVEPSCIVEVVNAQRNMIQSDNASVLGDARLQRDPYEEAGYEQHKATHDPAPLNAHRHYCRSIDTPDVRQFIAPSVEGVCLTCRFSRGWSSSSAAVCWRRLASLLVPSWRKGSTSFARSRRHTRSPNLVHDVIHVGAMNGSLFDTISKHSADLLDGSARPSVGRGHQKDHALDDLEGVVQHQT